MLRFNLIGLGLGLLRFNLNVEIQFNRVRVRVTGFLVRVGLTLADVGLAGTQH
jgi:hypothetical protein